MFTSTLITKISYNRCSHGHFLFEHSSIHDMWTVEP